MSRRQTGLLVLLAIMVLMAAGAVTAKAPTDLAYITNGAGISVIDVGEKKMVDHIKLGTAPCGIAMLPEGSHFYVVDSVTGLVYMVRTNNYKVEKKINIGPGGRKISITLDGRTAYVSKTDGYIKVIDLVQSKVVDSVKVGAGPGDMAVTVDNRHLAVANYASGTVSLVRTSDHKIEKTIPVGTNPTGVAADPNGFFIYVAVKGSNSVAIIDTREMKVVKRLQGFNAPRGIAFTPLGHYAFVANGGATSLHVIRVKTQEVIVSKVVLPATPSTMVVTGDNLTLLVNLEDGRTAMVAMNTFKVEELFKLRAAPQGIVIRSKE